MDGGIIGALAGLAFINVGVVITVGINNARKIGRVEGKVDGLDERTESVDRRLISLDRRVNHLYLNKSDNSPKKKRKPKS